MFPLCADEKIDAVLESDLIIPHCYGLLHTDFYTGVEVPVPVVLAHKLHHNRHEIRLDRVLKIAMRFIFLLLDMVLTSVL